MALNRVQAQAIVDGFLTVMAVSSKIEVARDTITYTNDNVTVQFTPSTKDIVVFVDGEGCVSIPNAAFDFPCDELTNEVMSTMLEYVYKDADASGISLKTGEPVSDTSRNDSLRKIISIVMDTPDNSLFLQREKRGWSLSTTEDGSGDIVFFDVFDEVVSLRNNDVVIHEFTNDDLDASPMRVEMLAVMNKLVENTQLYAKAITLGIDFKKKGDDNGVSEQGYAN